MEAIGGAFVTVFAWVQTQPTWAQALLALVSAIVAFTFLWYLWRFCRAVYRCTFGRRSAKAGALFCFCCGCRGAQDLEAAETDVESPLVQQLRSAEKDSPPKNQAKVPIVFSMEALLAATENFSPSRRIGRWR